MPNNELSIRDIHLPDSLHWWPPAIGWWLLAILLIASLVGLFLLIKRYRKKWGYRNVALALLKKDYKHWRQQNATTKSTASQEALQQMLRVLKRTAITAYPKADAASLHGQPWVDFLNQQTNSDYFQQQCSDILLNQQYQASANIDITAFYHACRAWVKHHHTRIKETRC